MEKIRRKFKLFISYSHHDEKHIELFVRHIAPLKTNGLIEDWYDRKILGGKEFQDKIDQKLEDADIICLCVSSSFLSSNACLTEKKNSIEYMKSKGTVVVPIILAPCGWQDDRDLSHLLALPTDGIPITTFSDSDTAWNQVYNEIKRLIKAESIIEDLEISDHFQEFLNSTDLLSRAHSQKEIVFLEDIFVYPELAKFDIINEYLTKIKSEKVIADFLKYEKIIIAGENQSGKTTFCKMVFTDLRRKHLVPVYLADRRRTYSGIIDNRISSAFSDQYKSDSLSEIDPNRIVPIIDDFHFAKEKDKHIDDLLKYRYQLLIVDDIFNLNFRDEQLIAPYTFFIIEELNPVLRNTLIKKWTKLTDKPGRSGDDENTLYKLIDEKTELVNTTIGKIFGRGIMPAYPFFLLSIISTYEAYAKPLNQEITSQGYCYQAFIYMYLRKQGVKNDEIDTYINFLGEFAFLFFVKSQNEVSKTEFDAFMKSYLEKYNLPVEQDILLEKLQKAKLIERDSFNNYSFCYPYVYYFFVGKYLAENLCNNKETVNGIVNNLQKDENAYIAIFISHHSKHEVILDEIVLNTLCMFEKYSPATLNSEELSFFDKQEEIIVQATLPSPNEVPEMIRMRRLAAQNDIEDKKQKDEDDDAEEYHELAGELRRSIKTVEVIGSIIKNRAGSLNKLSLNSMFEEAVNVHLRILTSFFSLIKTENEQQEIVNFISSRLNIITEDVVKERRRQGRKEYDISKEKLEKLSKTIFWNLNFFTIYGMINKIVTSLGSDQLKQVVETVCDKIDTPASFLIKHGILMWYCKNLQVDKIAEKLKDERIANITQRIMKFMIVDHCSMHKIDFKDRQKIEQRFKIPSIKLLEYQR